MSEVLWNIIGVTLIGCIILLVRKINGDRVYPQILTAYWIAFFTISLIPFSFIARVGAVFGNSDFVDTINMSGSRQKEYTELETVLVKQQTSSILHNEMIKSSLAKICLGIWIIGFLLCVLIKLLQRATIKKRIKEECIGIHSCVSIGRNNVNVLITENIGPMVYGIKPVIYVPKDFISSDIYNSILIHEKMHIVRKHYMLLLLIDLVSCIYWFLPYYEKIFMQALREDMEYRCDYEVIKNKSVNPKEYSLHYAIVNGHRSGLKVSLNFGRVQLLKRVNRILGCNVSMKETLYTLLVFVITIMVGMMSIANFYLLPDRNGFTKWEIKQAKKAVVNIINAMNKEDEQRLSDYIYKSGPLGNVTNFSDMECNLYYIDYFPISSNYYEKIYKEQHQLQENEIVHLEGILEIEGSEMIWGFTLIYDEIDNTWKLYDWGQ